MGLVSTKAIVFSTIKYGDTSLIVKCFTLEEGIKSYLIKGVLKSKKGKLKAAYFQPLTQLHLTANHNNKGNLNSIREAHVTIPYETIPFEIKKQTIVLFLSEILSNIIQEEEKNEGLYNYIETALIWLDSHDVISNFHLLFLMNLSRYLGFYPDTSNINASAFSLIEGSFTNSSYEKLTLTNENLTLFKKLLGINFDAINTVSFNKNERQTLLRSIIQYFELHLEGFKKPKSLDVLETVFS
ncbi:DNA replication and repair protein RecO [Tenacibaculum skagerrakense]|uniref:DNA repair protein RecO n=1 Tax=Tenacibaculum skagerrakense TaxID=186571 RepID=A0A4R2P1Y6_9FLAO|nr:DNA repair protein RecO [Tenacibaculum skagerrakense]TCP28098.1 DNA replication and repair protein RecO [Tenacibaculum skagerrakense]